jgi:hypothetical protein
MQKRVITAIIVVLLIAAGILTFVNRSGSEDRPGLVITSGGKETLVAWEDIEAVEFSGELVNGKGEVSQHAFTGQ